MQLNALPVRLPLGTKLTVSGGSVFLRDLGEGLSYRKIDGADRAPIANRG